MSDSSDTAYVTQIRGFLLRCSRLQAMAARSEKQARSRLPKRDQQFPNGDYPIVLIAEMRAFSLGLMLQEREP